jgi:hypothetical protein
MSDSPANKSANITSLKKLIALYSKMTDGDWRASARSKSYSSKREYVNMLKGKVSNLSEATTTGAVAPVSTPFAFSKRGPGNVEAATQLGFNIAPAVNKKDSHNIKESVSDSLYTKVSSILKEKPKSTKLVSERLASPIRLEQDDVAQQQQQQQAATQPTGQAPPAGDQQSLKTIDVQGDFSAFDRKLKGATEQFKTEFQSSVQKKLLGKQVVARASKGYKQPESDYTINVTGVKLDFFYDKYIIVLVGREENKQETKDFFIRPGYKLKVMGDIQDQSSSEAGKIAKSRALVNTNSQEPTEPSDDVTSDVAIEKPEVEAEPAPDAQAPAPEEEPDPAAPAPPQDPRKLTQRRGR